MEPIQYKTEKDTGLYHLTVISTIINPQDSSTLSILENKILLTGVGREYPTPLEAKFIQEQIPLWEGQVKIPLGAQKNFAEEYHAKFADKVSLIPDRYLKV